MQSSTSVGASLLEQRALRRAALQHRTLDDFEAVLANIIDDLGRVSSVERVSQLIVLMVRVSAIDQRAICLHILLQCTSDDCLLEFTRQGGYRVLSRWIARAAEEESLTELRTLLKLCRSLPVDEEQIRRAGLVQQVERVMELPLSHCETLKRKARKYLSRISPEKRPNEDVPTSLGIPPISLT